MNDITQPTVETAETMRERAARLRAAAREMELYAQYADGPGRLPPLRAGHS